MPFAPGLRAVRPFVVEPSDTAEALGSGDLPVLGTPRLLAWAEATTVAALEGRLGAGESSVGVRVELEHVAAAAVGVAVLVTADLVHVDGRLLRFSVAASAGDTVLGTATVTRVVVARERFMSRVVPSA